MGADAHTALTRRGERLRVLVVDHTALLRTVRRRWRRLAVEAEIDLTLVTAHAWPENSQWQTYAPEIDEPFRTVVGRVTLPGYEVRSFYVGGLARAIRETQPDVILMMEEAFGAFAVQVHALRRMYAPRARVIFYSAWIVPFSAITYRPNWFFNWLSRRMLPRLDAAMTVNDQATAMLREAGFERARTNFFGVDETLFTPVARREARRELGLDPHEAIFLNAGRWLWYKGLDDLIDAFARLAATRPDRPMRLVLIGAGEHEPALRERVAASGVADRIELRGAVPLAQVRVWMCAADAFVLPSRAVWVEQFGRVLAEAMLVGTPVVGSTSGAIPSVIGEGGFVYAADDVAALAAALARVLDEPDEVARRAAVAREIALREYSVEAFVRRTIETIEEVSGRRIRRDVEQEVAA